ncbi:MAG: hypothetical protein FWG32_06305 [Oscillospiraceae bacterium]|nr:hypothetical protein [Oscillospiraceae bacterium]
MSGTGFDFKRIFFAGVGAVAMTAEKTRELVKELVEKGEMTVEQGKIINEELKQNVTTKVRSVVDAVIPQDPSSVIAKMDSMNTEELAAVKAKLEEIENRRAEEENAGEE